MLAGHCGIRGDRLSSPSSGGPAWGDRSRASASPRKPGGLGAHLVRPQPPPGNPAVWGLTDQRSASVPVDPSHQPVKSVLADHRAEGHPRLRSRLRRYRPAAAPAARPRSDAGPEHGSLARESTGSSVPSRTWSAAKTCLNCRPRLLRAFRASWQEAPARDPCPPACLGGLARFRELAGTHGKQWHRRLAGARQGAAQSGRRTPARRRCHLPPGILQAHLGVAPTAVPASRRQPEPSGE
jgi:hypothetical protein